MKQDCSPSVTPQDDYGDQYRKKPVVIRAKQWFKYGDHPKVELYARGDDKGQAHLGCIKTLESGGGMHIVSVGDWIIQGVKGEFYACKPDIFAATYEPASVVRSENASTTEGYPGIAHDLETLRTALVTIRDECFSGNAYDIAVRALEDTK